MPQCKHYDICGRDGGEGTEEDLCILHSESPDKNKQAFDEALDTHRKERGDNFSLFVFPGEINFFGATFSEMASFDDATFSGEARFDGATFSGEASFYRATFSEAARFGGATFSEMASFGRATFSGEARFGGATFSGAARFGGATFSGAARFDGATFSGAASFFGATFSEMARFDDATFSGAASFDGATFSEMARFDDATFSGEARFDDATFSGEASFIRATFSGAARFGRATFSGAASFDGATFSEGADFSRAIFSEMANFLSAKFLGRVLFITGQKRDGSTALIFSGVEVDFREVLIEPLEALILRDADLRQCRFLNTDLRKAEITGAVWPKIRGRSCVYDEFVPLEEGEVRPWSRLERLYRELKQNYEDRRDYERAGDFHYGEKEMRRKNQDTSWSLWFFLTLYWAVSGYGERYLRPLVWAAALLAVSTILYLWLGLEGKWTGGRTSILSMSYVGDWLQAAHYSFRAMTFLKPEDVANPMGYSRAVHTAQSLLGPLFLGLFALAIRQRLKR